MTELPMHYLDESPPTANGAKGARPCRRHSWREQQYVDAIEVQPGRFVTRDRFGEHGEIELTYASALGVTRCYWNEGAAVRYPFPPVSCSRCGRLRDFTASRRGRTSLRAGKDAERAIARAYGGTRTGQFGGPDDVLVGDLFVVQSKAGGWFSERVWAELAKLPRSGGRIPTLIVSDRPGPGHKTRRYVVRTIDDDLDLHGPGAA